MKVRLIQVIVTHTFHVSDKQMNECYGTQDPVEVVQKLEKDLVDGNTILEDLYDFKGDATYNVKLIEIDI